MAASAASPGLISPEAIAAASEVASWSPMASSVNACTCLRSVMAVTVTHPNWYDHLTYSQ
jgi:hypothetical protein